jgi:hypothetical protein
MRHVYPFYVEAMASDPEPEDDESWLEQGEAAAEIHAIWEQEDG